MMAKKNTLFLFLWIRCFAGYCFYGIGIVSFLCFILPLSGILLLFGNGAGVFMSLTLRYYLAFLTRAFLPFLGIYAIKEMSGFENAKKYSGSIFVANHRGMLDGPLLLGILKNTAAVMKTKYAVTPPYSTLIKRLDFISLNQHSLQDIEKGIVLAKELLARGKNLLLFPEGTRSISGKPLPFREFAFRIARDINCPVVPVVIYSDFGFMSKTFKSFFPDRKDTFILRCLAPVKPLQNENAGDLASRVRKIIIDELAAMENTSITVSKG